MTLISYGPRWIKFAQENNEPEKYEFKYRPKIKHGPHDLPAVVGVKLICCNHGLSDDLSDDIENLSEETWSNLHDNLIHIAKNHCGHPCPPVNTVIPNLITKNDT